MKNTALVCSEEPPVLPDSSSESYFHVRPLTHLQDHLVEKQNIPRRLDCYEITWFRSGKGYMYIDTHVNPVQDNQLYYLIPGQSCNCQADQADGYHIAFSTAFLYTAGIPLDVITRFDQHIFRQKKFMVQPDMEDRTDIEEVILKMEREYTRYDHLRAEILKGLLNILLLYVSRKTEAELPADATPKDILLVKDFIGSLRKNYTSKKQVTDYAGELYITPNYLNKIVKRITGFTVSHHIQQQIILQAKQLAHHSRMSMKEIAYHLGFEDISHFSKFFKNNCGINFSEYKRAYLHLPGKRDVA